VVAEQQQLAAGCASSIEAAQAPGVADRCIHTMQWASHCAPASNVATQEHGMYVILRQLTAMSKTPHVCHTRHPATLTILTHAALAFVTPALLPAGGGGFVRKYGARLSAR
jgi:hypothetical protein